MKYFVLTKIRRYSVISGSIFTMIVITTLYLPASPTPGIVNENKKGENAFVRIIKTQKGINGLNNHREEYENNRITIGTQVSK